MGRLTRDPELRHTQSGIAVTRFTLACDRPFGKGDTDFVDCVVWRKPAESAAQYLSKGSMAGVDGRLQISSYDGQDGQKRYRAEVVADSVRFLDSRNNRSEDSTGQRDDAGSSQTVSKEQDVDPFSSPGTIDLSDDDLPF